MDKHPNKTLNEIDEIKVKYEKQLNTLLKDFEKEAGIIPFSGGLHIKGIKLIVGMGSTRTYFIDLEI
jgi:hypothetical protein